MGQTFTPKRIPRPLGFECDPLKDDRWNVQLEQCLAFFEELEPSRQFMTRGIYKLQRACECICSGKPFPMSMCLRDDRFVLF